MFRCALTLLAAAALSASAAFRQASAQAEAPAPNWVRTLPGDLHTTWGALDVRFDSQGSVITCGSSRVLNQSGRFTVAKWDRSGSHLWTRRLGETGTGDGTASVVTLDSGDNVIAAGYAREGTNPGEFVVAKWSPDGDLLWKQGVGAYGGPHGLALAADGSIFATATADSTYSSSAIVVKLAPADGTLLWTYRMDADRNERFHIYDLKVSASGDPVVCGRVPDTAGGFGVVKLAGATGERLWTSTAALTGSAWRLTLDNAGDVATTGMIIDAWQSQRLAVVKLDGSTGATLWQFLAGGSPLEESLPGDIVADQAGDVVVGGQFWSEQRRRREFGILKLKGADGSSLWQRSLIDSASFAGSGEAAELRVAPDNSVVAAGWVGSVSGLNDAAIGAWDAAGTLLWRQVIDGDSNSYDRFNAVDVDATGAVAVAGLFGSGYANRMGIGVVTGWHLQPRNPQVFPVEHPSTGGSSTVTVSINAPAELKSVVAYASSWSQPTLFHELRAGEDGLYSAILTFPANQGPEAREYTVRIAAQDSAGFRWSTEATPVVVAWPPAGRLWLGAHRVDIGRVQVGDGRTRQLALKNLGTQPLQVELTGAVSPFHLYDPGGPPGGRTDRARLSIPPRTRATLSVRFSPQTKGHFSQRLRLTSSDPRRPETTIWVSGHGKDKGLGVRPYSPPAPSP